MKRTELENEVRKCKKVEESKKASKLPYQTFFSIVTVMPVSGRCNKLPISIKANTHPTFNKLMENFMRRQSKQKKSNY